MKQIQMIQKIILNKLLIYFPVLILFISVFNEFDFNYLNYKYFNQKDLVRSVYISLNIVFCFWAIIAAVLLFMIAQKLIGNNYLLS